MEERIYLKILGKKKDELDAFECGVLIVLFELKIAMLMIIAVLFCYFLNYICVSLKDFIV